MPLLARPVVAQVAVEEQVHLRRHPALDVHAVGDVADRHLFLGTVGEQRLPHPPRDGAVQRADAIGVPRELQRQHGHAERLVVIGRVDPPQSHEVLVGQVQRLADLAQVLLHQRGREPVVAGGHRRVGGEDRHGRDVAHHLAERQAARHDLPADHLQRRECAVPLVEVHHRGGDLQRVQGPQPADAQEQLLADAGPGIAAVEPRRQRPVRVAVLRHVGVQQEERRAADLHPPDSRVQHAAGGLHRDQERLPVGAGHALDRQQLDVGVEVLLLLPAVGIERLAEIALRVQQADADQRDSQVAGALEMIAGQHPQAARVDRQALVQPELGREIRHRPGPQDRGVHRPPAIGVLQVLGQPAERIVDPRVQRHLRRPPLQLVDRQPLEELDRIVVDLPPERGSSSRNSAMTFGCHVHHKFRAGRGACPSTASDRPWPHSRRASIRGAGASTDSLPPPRPQHRSAFGARQSSAPYSGA